jgi:hypothetical protein
MGCDAPYQVGPADLITGVVEPSADGEWSVTWVTDDRALRPAAVRAPTLTQVIDKATSYVATLYATWPVDGAEELQFGIYPWHYEKGPIFEITARPGLFTARALVGSDQEFQEATLEGLIVAVERTESLGAVNSMFLWVRPIASLPPPTR